LEDKSFKKQGSFKIPSNTTDVRDIYLGHDFYLITCRTDEKFGRNLTWISYNEGKNWSPYKQNGEYRLVYCSFGKPFMIDKNNDIYVGDVVKDMKE